MSLVPNSGSSSRGSIRMRSSSSYSLFPLLSSLAAFVVAVQHMY